MRLAGTIFSNVTKMLDFYSQFNPSPLSIKQFIDFGKFFLLKKKNAQISRISRSEVISNFSKFVFVFAKRFNVDEL